MNHIHSNKGISPLIAAIILIAFVIAVGNVVGPWFMDFIEERTDQVTEKGREDVKCGYAGLHLNKVTRNQTSDNVTLTSEVENTENVELTNFRIELTHEDGTISNIEPENSNQTLKAGSRRTFSVEVNTTSEGNVKNLRIYSSDCPNNAEGEMESVYFEEI